MNEPEQLRERTKQFALRVIRLFQAFPKTTEAQVLGKQLLRAELPSLLTIVLPAGRDPELNSLHELELLLRKRMRVRCGWR